MVLVNESTPLLTGNHTVTSARTPSPNSPSKQPEEQLSITRLVFLTLALSGLQFAWSVEQGYGTPYLISLGMPKSLLSLVWLAGPLSGLIVHPLVGCISDNSTFRYGRRRPVILAGYVFFLISLASIAYTKEIVAFFWSVESSWSSFLILSLASLSFYGLDFSINASQAGIRALISDISPLNQQEIANAYASRMIGIGNIIGFFVGYVDLVSLFPWLGDTQMKILCAIASVFFGITLSLTCYFTKEQVYSRTNHSNLTTGWFSFLVEILKKIFASFFDLPSPIQSICTVQFFAWFSWFPFLFYSTTWMAEILGRSQDVHSPEFLIGATQAGSFAMFLYSLISVISSFLLPFIVKEEQESEEESSPDDGQQYIKGAINLLLKFNLRSVFAMSHFLFGSLMLSTVFVDDMIQATCLIALCGISWSVLVWALFSLLGEFTRLLGARVQPNSPSESNSRSIRLDSGLVLGIHNAYVVFPQLLVSLMSSFLFYYVQNKVPIVTHSLVPMTSSEIYIISNLMKNNSSLICNRTNVPLEINGMDLQWKTSIGSSSNPEPIGLLLRIGGISSLIAGALALKIPSLSSI